MITFDKIQGENCTNNGYQHYLDNFLEVPGWESENLGEIPTTGFYMYGLKRNTNKGKPIIFIQSSVHGDEYQSTFWARQFAKYIANPDLAPVKLRQLLREIDNTFAFYWIPIANPWGYENLQRFNKDDANTNADYGVTQYHLESIIIKNKFVSLKPVLFVDNHTWDNVNTPCHRLYGRKGNSIDNHYKIINNNWLSSTQMVTKEKVFEYWYPAPTDHFHSWSTYQIGQHGLNCMMALIEADKTKANSIQTMQGINALVSMVLHFYIWCKTRIENPIL